MLQVLLARPITCYVIFVEPMLTLVWFVHREVPRGTPMQDFDRMFKAILHEVVLLLGY